MKTPQEWGELIRNGNWMSYTAAAKAIQQDALSDSQKRIKELEADCASKTEVLNRVREYCDSDICYAYQDILNIKAILAKEFSVNSGEDLLFIHAAQLQLLNGELDELREQNKKQKDALQLWKKTLRPINHIYYTEGGIDSRCHCYTCQAIRATQASEEKK